MTRLIHSKPFVICPPDDLVQKNLDLREMSRRLADKYANAQAVTDDDLRVVVTDADLQIMGNTLWKMLGIQNDFDAAYSKVGAAILPVIIKSGAADVQALPWETLFHPSQGFIGKNPAFTLTRQFSEGREAARHLDKGPLRVLLFTSLPDDVNPETGRLNVEDEQAQVQEAFLQWIAKGLVELEMPDDGRFSTLKELLKRFQPHVLFLSGHGHFRNEPHTGEAPYGEFLFESEMGDSEAIKDNEIANVLIGMGVQVVVLSACESGKAASDVLSNGLMRRISAQGIPHVIGMRESIMDSAGIQFAHALCDSLAQRERIDFALQAARIAIQNPMMEISADEGSFGQWCLPMLISSEPDVPLINWDFQPKEMDGARRFKNTIGNIRLPEHFVGRRAELSQLKHKLFNGELRKLLITGPGGQGKTSLAGKLASDLQKRGWQVFAWSAKEHVSWRTFEMELEQALSAPRTMSYNRLPGTATEYEHAKLMLDLLMEQFNQQVIFVLDNLESIQDPNTQMLNDSVIFDWVKAALETQNLILLATSRWQIPGWVDEHLKLAGTNYSDFLQLAQEFGLHRAVLETRGGLRHVHKVLGGNGRGLEFFAAAVRNMQDPDEEHALLNALAKTKADLQADMAIAEIYKHLPSAAQKLVRRLPVYHEPVPLKGFVLLGSDLPEPQELLERLLAVSLLEASHAQRWKVTQYQCNSLVKEWLDKQNLSDDTQIWLNAAADYHLDLFLKEQRTLSRVIAAHHALRRAQRHTEADNLTLNHIIGPLTMAGSYATLLDEWLPPIYTSQDAQACCKALAHTGILLKNIGDYEKALTYLEQALTIQRQLKDKQIEGVLFNNMGITYQAQGHPQTALTYLEQALVVLRQIENKRGEAATLSNIAQVYQGQGDYKTALNNLKQALAIQQQIGDKAGEGTSLNNISQIFKALGDYETVLIYLKQALVIHQQIGDKSGESITLNNISGIYQRRNEYQTALMYLKQALAIQSQIGDKAGEGISLNNISGIYRRQGEYDISLEYLQQAQTIQQQIGDKVGLGMTLNNIGTTYQMRGELEKALNYLEQTLAIRKDLGDKAGGAQLLNNVGTIRQAQGDYVTALKNFEQALTVQREIGGKAGESTTLNNIGTAYQLRGDYETALEYLEQALTLTLQIGDQIGESTTLDNIGTVHQARGDYKMALEYMEQSLSIRRKISDQAGEAQSLNNIATVLQTQGDYKMVLKNLRQAVTIMREIGDQAGLCTILINLGHNHVQSKQMQEAERVWAIAYVIAKRIHLVQVLQTLEELASKVGLPEGLASWKTLVEKMDEQGIMNDAMSKYGPMQ